MSIELLSSDTLQEIARQYGYWAVFFGIALENTGIPIPGETITLAGGFLAGSGELSYWWVLGSAIAGAVLGDNFGYWIGRLGGWPLLVRIGKFFKVPEKKLEQARHQFKKNAAAAVFLGRFVTLLRIFAGPMAGIAQMRYPLFLLCNLGGAAVWALFMVTVSFFLGRLIPLHQILSYVSQLGLVALVAVGIWVIIYVWLESRKHRLELRD